MTNEYPVQFATNTFDIGGPPSSLRPWFTNADGDLMAWSNYSYRLEPEPRQQHDAFPLVAALLSGFVIGWFVAKWQEHKFWNK